MTDAPKPSEKPLADRVQALKDGIKGDVIDGRFHVTELPVSDLHQPSTMLTDLWADYQAKSAEPSHD